MNGVEELFLERMTVRRWLAVVLCASIVFGAAGWFAGREYLRHQIREELASAIGNSFLDGMQKTGEDLSSVAPPQVRQPTPSTPPVIRQSQAPQLPPARSPAIVQTPGTIPLSADPEYQQFVDGFRSLKSNPKFRNVRFVAGHTGPLPVGTVDVTDSGDTKNLTPREKAMMTRAFQEVFGG